MRPECNNNLPASDDSADGVGGLRRWARGLLPLEAAVLLIVSAADGRLLDGPWIRRGDHNHIWFDADLAAAEGGYLSGGEQRVLAIATSLASGDHPVDLGDAVTGVAPDTLWLVLDALAHASGQDALSHDCGPDEPRSGPAGALNEPSTGPAGEPGPLGGSRWSARGPIGCPGKTGCAQPVSTRSDVDSSRPPNGQYQTSNGPVGDPGLFKGLHGSDRGPHEGPGEIGSAQSAARSVNEDRDEHRAKGDEDE